MKICLNKLRTFFITVFTLGIVCSAYTQNLVPNPSFEIFTSCPQQFGGGNEVFEAPPWQNATDGTCDYFNVCADPNYCGIPVNFFGVQPAHTGIAYGGGSSMSLNYNYREYLQVQLLSPLVKDQFYHLSLYISLGDNTCGHSHYGVYFSNEPPDYFESEPLDVVPQIETNVGFLSDVDNWMHIDACFVAYGGEQWITFGNFMEDIDTPLDPSCPHFPFPRSYYYLDDVSVMASTPDDILDFDLGGPVAACYEYTIDPDVEGQIYWSDGSYGPTLTVYESGVYTGYLVDSCRLGIDSIEVTILGDPVEIDLVEVGICTGDVYTISFDAEYGNYAWSDGSTDSFIEITTAGIYSVTLDDGCDITSDEIEVFEFQPPPPDFLGDDQFLCYDDVITFPFDETMGDFLWQDGSTDPAYAIEFEGNYALTISNACGVFSDAMNVVAVVEPEVDLNYPTFLCEGDTLFIELDPLQGEYNWQDGSNASSYIISGPGYYEVFVTNACGEANDDLTVSSDAAPQLTLGEDITVCPSQLPLLLNAGSSGAETYVWNDNSIDSQLLVTQAGIYSVSMGNLCGVVVDSISVSVDDTGPSVILPGDTLLCHGDVMILTSIGDSGNYLWQDGSSADTLTVSAAGLYVLSVTNACGTSSDSTQINYQPTLEEPNLGSDFTLCAGESFTIATGIDNVMYQWQDMSTADSFLVSSPGLYHVVISDQCSSATDSVIVTTGTMPPDVNLPAFLELCQGDTLDLESGISGVLYQWEDGSQQPTLQINTAGTYSITVSNGCGSDVDSVIVQDKGPKPLVELGPDLSECLTQSILVTPTFSNVNTWLWHDGSTMPSFEVVQGGLVTVEVTNVCGTSIDSLEVIALPPVPLLDLGADTLLCPGESITFSILIADVEIEWPDGSVGQSYTVSDEQVVHAIISNQCGVSTDDVAVTLLEGTPLLDLGPDQSLCPGEIVQLSPGIANVDYEWQDGSMLSVYEVTTPGIISLTVSNSCGLAVDTIEIIEDINGPEVDLGLDVQACSGEVITLESNIGGVDYLWQDGSTEASLVVSASGIYVLQVSNLCGMDVDSIEVDLEAVMPSPTLGSDTILCDNAQLQLHSNAMDGTSVLWQDGSTLSVLNVSDSGTYILSESNQCGSVSDSILVQYEASPQAVDLGQDTILCSGQFIILHAPVTSASIVWQDGSSGTQMIADQEQTYSIMQSNICGSVTDEIQIFYDHHVPLLELDSVSLICPGQEVMVDVTQPFDAQYHWNDGSTLPVLHIHQPGLYSVQVVTWCGAVEEEIEVQVRDDCDNEIFIPNIFSPNGDFINDQWELFTGMALEVLSVTCSVFDRWGNLVFELHSMPIAWDGSFRGTFLDPGVYVYRISLEYKEGTSLRKEILTGDVTIVK